MPSYADGNLQRGVHPSRGEVLSLIGAAFDANYAASRSGKLRTNIVVTNRTLNDDGSTAAQTTSEHHETVIFKGEMLRRDMLSDEPQTLSWYDERWHLYSPGSKWLEISGASGLAVQLPFDPRQLGMIDTSLSVREFLDSTLISNAVLIDDADGGRAVITYTKQLGDVSNRFDKIIEVECHKANGFLPSRTTLSFNEHVNVTVELAYKDAVEGQLRVPNTVTYRYFDFERFRTFSPDNWHQEISYFVESFEPNVEIDDATFRIEPDDGTLIVDTVAARRYKWTTELQAPSSRSSSRRLIIAVNCVVLCAIALIIVWRRARRKAASHVQSGNSAGRRPSVPQ